MNPMKLMADEDEAPEREMPMPEQAERLQKTYAAYSVTHEFKPGDIVRLKENGGPYRREFSPAIVMEVGVKGSHRDGDACQGVEESLRIGSIARDGGFISFLVIPNYWEPCTE